MKDTDKNIHTNPEPTEGNNSPSAPYAEAQTPSPDSAHKPQTKQTANDPQSTSEGTEGNTGAPTVAQANQEQERTFTQEEVNNIVKERLARVKRGEDLEARLEDLEQREKALAEREAELERTTRTQQAEKLIEDNRLSPELLPLLINADPEEQMEMLSIFKRATGHRATGMRRGSSPETPTIREREAFGLK